MTARKMSLDAFLSETAADLERFREAWLRENANNPEAFPLEIEEGLWIEQLLHFWNADGLGDGEQHEPSANPNP